MQLNGDSFILSPSDLGDWLLCGHLSSLERSVAAGVMDSPERDDATAQLIAHKGEEHESAFRSKLTAKGVEAVEIPVGRDVGGLAAGERATFDAMRQGVPAIFQATFFDGRWRGHADLLERVDTPSDLGSWSYEVVDVKLARTAKVRALLQASSYSEQLTRLQGVAPLSMHLQLGDGQRQTFVVDDFAAYYRAMKRAFERHVSAPAGSTYPLPVSHCPSCQWNEVCKARRVEDDHLCLVAGIGRSQVEKLNAVGVNKVTELGRLPHDAALLGIDSAVLNKLRSQARLQLEQRETGKVSFELLEPSYRLEGKTWHALGLGALPEPSPGDLFFDIEGDPWVGRHGIEYLFGVTDADARFHSFWGHDAAGEKAAFEGFVDLAMDRLSRSADMHIFHYAPYEVTAMKRLSARYATREAQVDVLLRGEVFVDLYQVVRQGIRISQDSYSIKKLEPLYTGERETEITDGAQSIIVYENWRETRNQALLDEIEAYNKDDCDSTLMLRDWLEVRRSEAIERFGDFGRPSAKEGEASEEQQKADSLVARIKALLLGDVPVDGRTEDQQARWLLAQLIEWHRREDKADWWQYFELLKCSTAELATRRDPLAGLEYVGEVGVVGRSSVHRYRFDPEQEFKIKVDDKPHDPATGKAAGEVVAIDDERGLIDLKRSTASAVSHPVALIPGKPIGQRPKQQALIDFAASVCESGTEASGRFDALRGLLMLQPPSLGTSGGTVAEQAVEAAKGLDGSYLAIQGPPGSGKTHTGAEIVLALVAQGKRVGVTAQSHKVIANLLEKIHAIGQTKAQPMRMMQRINKDKERCSVDSVEFAVSNEIVASAIADDLVDVVGGTGWLFARAELRERFDVLLVDEASQLSLAEVLAVGTCARSLVLLGDPQQLAQPGNGVHPDGADVSALQHILGGHDTMPEKAGLLLDRTWRMHSDICTFVSNTFYDGRLHSVDDCAQQTIEGEGTGLRYLPVEHSGNRTSSPEEAEVIRREIDRLVGCKWTDAKGETRLLSIADILVVAPYNAQVATLGRLLPEGSRVGTVDKFQGQEAAVVFYSTATSAPENISRGMEFLYDGNRLNVAVSRARCLSYLVMSPKLLTYACRKPAQAELVNAFCSFVEQSR